MVNSFIAKKDLDTEMTVVRNEYEMGENDPSRVHARSACRAMLYDWHNYGNSTIGNRSDIENVRIENLQAFYRIYYQPDNAVLTVAGKFDEAQGAALGGASPSARSRSRSARCRRCGPWSRRRTASASSRSAARARSRWWWWRYRMPSHAAPRFSAAAMAADILGDTPTGRLHKALVETGKAAQVFAFTIDGTRSRPSCCSARW